MRKLAITISGAVSLGSYEAGVLYEVFAALKSHNAQCDLANLPDDKVWIDVITGASAGGMSAAIAVQKLLYQADQLEGANTNALYLPWVKEISLQRLLADNAAPNQGRSILCSDVIDEIATKHLLGRYTSAGTPPAPNPHPAAAPLIHLGLAMSNMNGVDYAIPINGGTDFIYTRFADDLSRNISGGSCDNRTFWQQMQQAILACGAFPFAFLPREVPRHRAEYTRPNLFTPDLPAHDPMPFAYVDGGLFQNEPLGLAKNLVDAMGVSGDDRTYLYIAPSIRQSEVCNDFRATTANYLALTERLVTGIFNQSRFQDWIDTDRINRKTVAAHSVTADAFEHALKTGRTSIDQLHQISASLAPDAHKAFVEGTGPKGMLKAKRRGLEKQYKQLMAEPTIGAAGADAWINAVTATGGSAEVYDVMRIDTIIAKPQELSGGDLEAFAGFFDESYRQHDYNVGRLKAQQMLTGGTSCLGAMRGYVPAAITPPPSLNPSIDASRLDKKLRQQLRDRLRIGIKAVLAQSKKANWLERWIADVFIVKGMLNAWLKL